MRRIFLFIILFSNFCLSQVKSFEGLFEKIEEIYIPEVKKCTAISISDNLIFVGDSDQHKIIIYENGKLKKSFGRLSHKEDGIDYIWAIALNKTKNEIFVKANYYGIIVFDFDGKFKYTIPLERQFVPRVLKVFNGKLYAAMGGISPLVMVFENGKKILEFGEFPEKFKGYANGGFISMDVDKDGIFLAQPLDYPIYIYDFEGKLKGKIGEGIEFENSYKRINLNEYKGSLVNLAYLYDMIISLDIIKDQILLIYKKNNDKKWERYLNIFNKKGDLLEKGIYLKDFIILSTYGDFVYFIDNEKLYKGKYRGVLNEK